MIKIVLVASGLVVLALVAGPAGAQTPSDDHANAGIPAEMRSVSPMDADLAERVRRSVATAGNTLRDLIQQASQPRATAVAAAN